MLPWLLCLVLLIAVLALLVKVRLLQKSMDEIARELGERLSTDTNVLLSVSSRDKRAMKLADDLNRHLKLLREQRHRFQSGDRELKEAVTNISHDLRTPLTAICGYLDLLEREGQSPEIERYLALIANRTEAMKQLTEELFRYSVILSVGEVVLAAVDMVSVLEESIAGFYGPLKERGIEPVIDLPGEAVVRRLDRTMLSRVFDNVLSNVLKYSAGDLNIVMSADGEVSFSNTAPDLDEVRVGRLFDRFFTVEAARGSTGLGLSIARTLVERMGGTITAEYEVGTLTIRVKFPDPPS